MRGNIFFRVSERKEISISYTAATGAHYNLLLLLFLIYFFPKRGARKMKRKEQWKKSSS